MNYRNHPAISQSRLKRIINHPKSYRENKPLQGASLSMGSLVDCLVLTPDEFNDTFYLSKELEVPSAIKEIWKSYYKECETFNNFDVNDESLLLTARNLDYRSKNKDEVVLQHVKKHEEYFQAMVDSNGKIIISQTDLDQAEQIKQSLLTNQFTSHIFEETTDTQLEIYWKMNDYPNLEFKSLLDMCTFNHDNKTIQPRDLKTTGESTRNFKKSIYRFRYDFQAAFYTFALHYAYPEYTILPFEFIVESTKFVGSPMIYRLSEYSLKIGAFGGQVDGVEYKGFIQCLNDLMWHTKEDKWDYPRELYESKGIVII